MIAWSGYPCCGRSAARSSDTVRTATLTGDRGSRSPSPAPKFSRESTCAATGPPNSGFLRHRTTSRSVGACAPTTAMDILLGRVSTMRSRRGRLYALASDHGPLHMPQVQYVGQHDLRRVRRCPGQRDSDKGRRLDRRCLAVPQRPRQDQVADVLRLRYVLLGLVEQESPCRS